MTKKIVIEIKGLDDVLAEGILPQLKASMPMMVKAMGPGMTEDNLEISISDDNAKA